MANVSNNEWYRNISLNKMFLYTGQFLKLFENIDQANAEEVLKYIYSERKLSNVDTDHDLDTLQRDKENFNIEGFNIEGFKFESFKIEGFKIEEATTDIKASYCCLGYIYYIHKTMGMNTLFLNPFFFPFHRAFIGSDGIHDADPRTDIKNFWDNLTKNKRFRNKVFLKDSIINTSIQPDPTWSDEIVKKCLSEDGWKKLNVKKGHDILAYNSLSERKVANVIIPIAKYFDSVDALMKDANINRENYISIVVSDKKKSNDDVSDPDDDDVAKDDVAKDDVIDAQFYKTIQEKLMITPSIINKGFAVVDCAGPSSKQLKKILNLETKGEDNNITSIVSGVLDSSSGSTTEGLSKHLANVLKTLNYILEEELCILLPEVSIKMGDNTITEIMQKIVISYYDKDNDKRKMTMSFLKWKTFSLVSCPYKYEVVNDEHPVIIDDDDKCPSVNETIKYIYSNLGVEQKSLLNSLISCCFGTLNAASLRKKEKINVFLNKYKEAFEFLLNDIDIVDKDQYLSGCLFRIKTMGDFYRLADTALIQYLLYTEELGNPSIPSILGTCDGYNAINAFASNNLTTIYHKPPLNFSFHSVNNYKLSSAELEKQQYEINQKAEEQKALELQKAEEQKALELQKAEEQKALELQKTLEELKKIFIKLNKPSSKILTSLENMKDLYKMNEFKSLMVVVETKMTKIYRTINSEYQPQTMNSRNIVKYTYTFNLNKIAGLNLLIYLREQIISTIFLYLSVKNLYYYLNKNRPTNDVDINDDTRRILPMLLVLNAMPFPEINTLFKNTFKVFEKLCDMFPEMKSNTSYKFVPILNKYYKIINKSLLDTIQFDNKMSESSVFKYLNSLNDETGDEKAINLETKFISNTYAFDYSVLYDIDSKESYVGGNSTKRRRTSSASSTSSTPSYSMVPDGTDSMDLGNYSLNQTSNALVYPIIKTKLQREEPKAKRQRKEKTPRTNLGSSIPMDEDEDEDAVPDLTNPMVEDYLKETLTFYREKINFEFSFLKEENDIYYDYNSIEDNDSHTDIFERLNERNKIFILENLNMLKIWVNAIDSSLNNVIEMIETQIQDETIVDKNLLYLDDVFILDKFVTLFCNGSVKFNNEIYDEDKAEFDKSIPENHDISQEIFKRYYSLNFTKFNEYIKQSNFEKEEKERREEIESSIYKNIDSGQSLLATLKRKGDINKSRYSKRKGDINKSRYSKSYLDAPQSSVRRKMHFDTGEVPQTMVGGKKLRTTIKLLNRKNRRITRINNNKINSVIKKKSRKHKKQLRKKKYSFRKY
jgi:hypothetical protein